MADRAIEILTNPGEAREMGRRGQEHVGRLFSRDTIAGQYEALYESLSLFPPRKSGAHPHRGTPKIWRNG